VYLETTFFLYLNLFQCSILYTSFFVRQIVYEVSFTYSGSHIDAIQNNIHRTKLGAEPQYQILQKSVQ